MCVPLDFRIANETKTKHSGPQPTIYSTEFVCVRVKLTHTHTRKSLFMWVAHHNYTRPHRLRCTVTLLTHSRKLYSFRQRQTVQWMWLVISKRQQRWLYVQRHRVELFYCNEHFGAIIKWEQTLFTPASGVSAALAVRIGTPRLF